MGVIDRKFTGITLVVMEEQWRPCDEQRDNREEGDVDEVLVDMDLVCVCENLAQCLAMIDHRRKELLKDDDAIALEDVEYRSYIIHRCYSGRYLMGRHSGTLDRELSSDVYLRVRQWDSEFMEKLEEEAKEFDDESDTQVV